LVQLIALDIDGTLLDARGQVPPRNLEALERAFAAGIEIVLATGRRYDFARPVFEQLPGPVTVIASNGAVVKGADGATLVRHLLPREVARSVLAAVPHHRDTTALLFDREREGQIVYERVDWHHPRYRAFFRANQAVIAEIAPLEEALTEDPLQVIFTGGCREMRVLFERLRAGESDLAHPAAPSTATDRALAVVAEPSRPVVAPHEHYSVALTEYLHRDFSMVDVIRAGCSKGAALREWVGRRRISREQVMAIGDNLNDLQMLEFAGHPVVMGNALAELKARGWRVTTTNDEAGVGRAIDEILPPAGRVQDRD
jgi:hydroxymethylpyrimidine pyrophosphatase-like HAD family hydrolase